MTPDAMDPGTRRVRDEVADRLRTRGIETTPADSLEDLVRLLEAVEEFERTVERKGGDLMVDEPIGSGRPLSPDGPAFVLPTRGEREPISALIGRIVAAQSVAARSHRDKSTTPA